MLTDGSGAAPVSAHASSRAIGAASGFVEAHGLLRRGRCAVRRIRHRLPGQRRRPLSHPGRHRGDPDPQVPPADRRSWRPTALPIRRCGGRSAWCWRAGTTPPGSASRPRRPTPRMPTWAGTPCCWCCRPRPSDCICPHTWKYPIVGRIPYKGFFDPRRPGGRPTGSPPGATTSTSGPRPPSPPWAGSTTRCSRPRSPGDSVELAATVFHEIAHNTLYVKSATPFNESFAQLVGYRSAAGVLPERGDSRAPGGGRSLARRNRAGRLLRRAGAPAAGALRQHRRFRRAGARAAAGRRWARAQLAGAGRRNGSGPSSIGRLAERPINNAQLVGARIYRTRLDLFDRWYEQHGRDVGRSVARSER